MIIDNWITLVGIPEKLKSWLSTQLTFDNPKFLDAVKNNRYTRNIPQHIKLYKNVYDGIAVPRGYLQLLEELLIGKGFDISIADNRVLLPPVQYDFLANLTDYQKVSKLQLMSHPNGLLVAPAASGKTVIGLSIIASTRQPTLWLVHTDRLAKQVIDRIVGTDEHPAMFKNIKREEIGFLGRGKRDVGERITVALIPTLTRHLDLLMSVGRRVGTVILDECHHAPAETFTHVLLQLPSYYLYGLTATPYRRDGLEDLMFSTIGQGNAVVKRSDVKAQGRIITPSVTRRAVRGYAGGVGLIDYHGLIRDVLTVDGRRKNLICEDVVREARAGNHCIVISLRKTYCEDLFSAICEFWPRSVIATGDYTAKHNDEQVKKMENGDASVLVTTFELLGEGFDVPKLNRAFLTLPFRDKARVEQLVGRIQRVADGKEDAVIYDYVDVNYGLLVHQYKAREEVYTSLGMSVTEDGIAN